MFVLVLDYQRRAAGQVAAITGRRKQYSAHEWERKVIRTEIGEDREAAIGATAI